MKSKVPNLTSRIPETASGMVCPGSKRLRERLRAMASDLASSWRSGLLPSDVKTAAGLRREAEALVKRAGAAADHVGWTMVTIVSEYWRERLASGPSGRRLLLLPDCPLAKGVRVEGMPNVCGPQCTITTLWTAARDSGWAVESTSRAVASMGSLLAGQYDGILGVARLVDLEKAFAKLPAFALPVAAVPYEELHAGHFDSCAASAAAQSIDPEWILGLLGVAGGSVAPVGDYLPLLREASELFTPRTLQPLLGRLGVDAGSDAACIETAASLQPLQAADILAMEFLARGGKFLRPFITLAAFDAVAADRRDGVLLGNAAAPLPPRDAVRAAAVSIEVFHKASLVHDDIEDDDRMRYGRATLHVEHGVPTAINVGDYLVGLGYRIVCCLPGVEPAVRQDLISQLSNAHMRLAQGQGAELWWRDAADKRLSPADSIEIYGLKTSPAFEAALSMGIRLAGVVPEEAAAVRRYAQHVGAGFQVLNDLKDWSGDLENDRRAAGDLLGGRPTLMWALAMQRLPPRDAVRLGQIAASAGAEDATARDVAEAIATARSLFISADVFRRAAEIVAEQRSGAAAAAATCRLPRLLEVLEFLLDLAVPDGAAAGMVG